MTRGTSQVLSKEPTSKKIPEDKNYNKIAEYVGSRSFLQILTFGGKYFRSEAKIPKGEEEFRQNTS